MLLSPARKLAVAVMCLLEAAVIGRQTLTLLDSHSLEKIIHYANLCLKTCLKGHKPKSQLV